MIDMTRKTKARRISLKEPQTKRLKQVWILREDHGNIPTLAQAIKIAHPGTNLDSIADVIHFCFEATRKAAGLQGA
jgi:hypothetical protein